MTSQTAARRTLYAHTGPTADRAGWETLTDHLEGVGQRCEGFARWFDAGPLGRLIGLCHDLGKAAPAWQEGVLGAGIDESLSDADDTAAGAGPAALAPRQRIDHSTAGARYITAILRDADRQPHPVGILAAYGIAGHHGRMPDHSGDGSNATLQHRLDRQAYPTADLSGVGPRDLPAALRQPVTVGQLLPGWYTAAADSAALSAFSHAFLARMLYSALVDADRLATEHFCDRPKSNQRPTPLPMAVLRDHLNRHLEQLRDGRAADPAPVDAHRAAVLQACRDRAADAPGLFSLTVPTGGGKTLASLAFALDHACQHALRRVVYALPFTSIIEQTAQVLRGVFKEPAFPPHTVLEHHSNLDPDGPGRASFGAQLAAENFDSPIVVTTNVQLFESLFSAHGSTCRKLHNLAGSVIVLDEAQAIPPLLLRPVLAAIQELTARFRCTIVLCTATQPAITHRDDFPIGLKHVREIISQPSELYTAMRRVEVAERGHLTDDALVDELADLPQVLCIVNTRKHAAALTQKLSERCEVLHLSAAMCPAHRSDRVALIRRRLLDREPCRVVSTQVIEAGVDVDFPVVYRSLAGFDSIAQAAGRCNREGRQARGEVHVFTPDAEHQPARSMQPLVHAAGELLDRHRADLLSLDATSDYFELAYWKLKQQGERPWDHRDVMGCFGGVHQQSAIVHQFREADRRFRWIDSATTPIVVPYGRDGQAIAHHLRTADEPDWLLLRRAQRFSVAAYDHQLRLLQENTTIEPCFPDPLDPSAPPRFWRLTNPQAYDQQLGLRFDVAGWDAAGLMA